MSLSNILNTQTKNENWSALNCYSLNAGTLTIDNMEVKELTVGTSPNQYTLPTNQIDVNGVPVMGNAGVMSFKQLKRMNLVWGGVANANPRFLVSCAPGNTGASATRSHLTDVRFPLTVILTRLTITTLNGNNTSQWNIYNNGSIVHTFTFDANGTYGVPTTITFVAGEQMSISWTGGGTQPNDSQIIAFFTEG